VRSAPHCRACVTRELTITTYVETIAALEADLAHSGEVVAAAVEALHQSHRRAASREEQHARLLAECQALRAQLRGDAHPPRAA
jgi:hypothetical protein